MGWIQPVLVTHPTSSGRGSDHYWFSVGPVVVHSPTTIGYFPALVLLCATALRKSLFEEAENGPAGGVNAA